MTTTSVGHRTAGMDALKQITFCLLIALLVHPTLQQSQSRRPRTNDLVEPEILRFDEPSEEFWRQFFDVYNHRGPLEQDPFFRPLSRPFRSSPAPGMEMFQDDFSRSNFLDQFARPGFGDRNSARPGFADQNSMPRIHDRFWRPGSSDQFLRPGHRDPTLSPDSDDRFLRPGSSDRDGFLRPGSSDRDRFLRPGSSDRDRFLRPGSSDRDRFLRPGSSDRDQFLRPGSSDGDQYLRPGSSDRFLRPGSDDRFLKPGFDDRFSRPGNLGQPSNDFQPIRQETIDTREDAYDRYKKYFLQRFGQNALEN